MKYVYSLTVAPALALAETRGASMDPLGWARGSRSKVKKASPVEVAAARAWNVLNEGKPFTVVFVSGMLLLLTLLRIGEPGAALRALGALLAIAALRSGSTLPAMVIHFLNNAIALLVVAADLVPDARIAAPVALAGTVGGTYLLWTATHRR